MSALCPDRSGRHSAKKCQLHLKQELWQPAEQQGSQAHIYHKECGEFYLLGDTSTQLETRVETLHDGCEKTNCSDGVSPAFLFLIAERKGGIGNTHHSFIRPFIVNVLSITSKISEPTSILLYGYI